MRLSSILAVAAGLLVPAQAAPGTLAFDYSQPLATFKYSTAQGGDKNWIGIYQSYYGGPDNQTYVSNSLTYAYAPKSEGTVQINVSKLGSGHFKAYFLANDGYKWLADPTEFTIQQGPVKFLLPLFTTHNARQESEFKAIVSGLANNAGDERNVFSKVDGPAWASVSAQGVVTGTPKTTDQSSTVVVGVVAADGSSDKLQVQIPIVPKGKPLVSSLKVMSFNLWHGGTQVNGYHKKQINYLANTNVDIVGVQESRYGHTIRMAKALGWSYWQSDDVGVLSRYPIVEIYPEVVAGGSVRIALDGTDNQIILWNAHLGYDPYGPYDFCFYNMTMDQVMKREEQSGRTPQIKEIVSKMKAQIANSDNIPVLLTGDFNAASHLDWTEANKAAHCNVGYVPWPSSIEPVNAGLIDSFRQKHPDPVRTQGITWSPIYLKNGDKDEPLDRIDYVYYKSKKLSVINSETLVVGKPTAEPNHANNEWTSDHAAVMTTFKFQNCKRK